MQNAKDTFYRLLRDRIASGNRARTVVVRGVERPAVLVAENELPNAAVPLDTFVLRWTAAKVDVRGELPLREMECSIRYETKGSDANGGIDRGRSLSAMDAELMAALLTDPQRWVKTDASVTPAAVLGTNVFWAAPVLGVVDSVAERMGRTALVTVFSYDEAGER